MRKVEIHKTILSLQSILAEVESGRWTSPPGLVERVEGAIAALKALV